MPYLGAVFSVFWFAGFAYRTPIASKLYRETFYSLILGMATAAPYPYYYRHQYIKLVNDVYWDIKGRFELYPHLNKPDPEHVVKNFGMTTRWNDHDFESEEDLELDDMVSIFDGHEHSDREEMIARI